MGIPSYFSYIIKNYSNIIQNCENIKEHIAKFHYLFMDCNSIIYDEFRKLEENIPKNTSKEDIEKLLISNIINKIMEYIHFIKPSQLVFIAFDGVAPLSKMEQQRNRRFKVSMSSKIDSIIKSEQKESIWSTSNITPGTKFMNELSKRIRNSFSNLENHFQVKNIIVSGSDERGEGEHKIFQYIRESKILNSSNCCVYGLDSDLIMLSLFHRKFFENLFVFRETPEFGKQIIEKQNQESPYLFLSIPIFANAMLHEMNCNAFDENRLYDYVFMCFLLGNDFLPHFPCLNIRTNGIDILLNTYRNIIGKHGNRSFISHDLTILWKWVFLFFQELAKNEHSNLLAEYELKKKHSKRKWEVNDEPSRELTLSSVPTILRSEELYISPDQQYWEHRYYKTLFNRHVKVKDICINYLEGLEWVFKYYTQSCPNWKWKYNYHYPPLMKDLLYHIPKKTTQLIDKNDHSFSPLVQLSYVLPIKYHNLLPEYVQEKLQPFVKEYYNKEIEYQWAFCRYFWEAHACLPEIPVSLLETWNHEF